MPANTGRVAFGEFSIDLQTGELRKSGTVLKLRPQSASILCHLVSRAGKLVGRDEIRRLLWGESTFVDYDSGVDHSMNRIRAVLCDRASAPRYIETVPRRGYRFIAPVRRERPFAEPTLAVLPFANLNSDPATDYFADGVTDALITELARIPAVRVISRQSVLHLKGSVRKLDEIARELGLDGVVEGTALHGGDRVRVTAQLILMDPERHAWAQSYDCDLSDVLTTQREAARAIAACVAKALNPRGVAMPLPAVARPVAPEVVEAYLKARSELHRGSAEAIGKALQDLRELTTKAPDFAPGLATYAACLFSLGWFGNAPAREVYPSAKQMALQAVAIDDSLSGAHQVLATIEWILDWDMAAADREFRRAIELSPSDPEAHTLYSIFLSGVARHSEAISEALYGLGLNPTALFPNQAAAWIYLHASHYGKAEAQARRTVDLFPDSLQPQFVLGWAVWRQSRAEEAVAAFEKALAISREALALSFLGHVYARLGRTEEARSKLREIEQLFNRGHASPIAFAIVHAGLGELDAALDWLETAYRLRCDMLWLTEGFPGIDPLRSFAPFADFIRRIGFTPV
jgi:TolB-like protein/Flp pilus assembly protein TadD